MADLRGAIRHYRVIRFTYDGRKYEAEPHELSRNPVTGTSELKAWVRRSSAGGDSRWMTFHYWSIRAMDVLPDKFLPRASEKSLQSAS
ncbi:hypothetical protein [Luteolibacter soli]